MDKTTQLNTELRKKYDDFFLEAREGIFMYPFLNTVRHKIDNNKREKYLSYLERSDIEQKDSILYLHVPFCKTQCMFCFWEIDVKKEGAEIIDEYLKALKKELLFYAQRNAIKNGRIKTLYVGGGTPSILKADQIKDLFGYLSEIFDLKSLEEFTFEFEIRTITEEKIALLKELGVTRMSCGWQTYDEKVRKSQGLIPSVSKFNETLGLLHKYSIPVNVDLLYGLPGQTYESCKNDIDQLLRTPTVASTDLYKCDILPNTLNYKHDIKKKMYTMDEREKKSVYHYFRKKLLAAGWDLCSCQLYYNPAVPKAKLRHVDYIYENNHNHIAAGPKCLGRIGDYFTLNIAGVDNYLQAVNNDEIPPLALLTAFDLREFSNMNMVIFPRRGVIKKSSLDIETLKDEQGKILYLAENDYLVETDDSLKLTNKGMDHWSSISEIFLSEEGKMDKYFSFLDLVEEVPIPVNLDSSSGAFRSLVPSESGTVIPEHPGHSVGA